MMEKFEENAKKLLKHFIKLDLSTEKGVNIFTEDVFDYGESIYENFDPWHREHNSSDLRWDIEDLIEKLESLQVKISPFIKYILNPRSKYTDKRHYRLQKTFILKKAKTLSNMDIVEEWFLQRRIPLISIICQALMILTRDKFVYFKSRECRECGGQFAPKTVRDQFFCSKKCRDNNRNGRRIESGEHARYMKLWREEKKKKKENKLSVV